MTGRAPSPAAVSAALGVLAGLVLSLLTRTALIDDAWITLDYARNLAGRGEWALVPGLPANTQTSPANALLLAGLVTLGAGPTVAVGIVLAAALGLVGWCAASLAAEVGRPLMPVGVGLVLLLATLPALVATVGLETYLAAAVLLGLARYATAGRSVPTGALLGGAVLVRPDLAVPALILVGVLLTPRRWPVAAVLAVVVASPWHLAAWRWLGGFVPDTFAVKTTSPRVASMLTAPVTVYGALFPVATALAAAVVAAGALGAVLVAWRRMPGRRPVVALAAAGWGHYAALVAIGAFPQLWYFAPLLICSSAAALLALDTSRRPVAVPVAMVGVAVVCAAGAVVAGPVWTRPPMMTNLGTAAEYAAAGRDLGRLTGGAPVAGPGEIGTLAAFSSVPVLDFLSHPGLTRPWLDLAERRSGATLRALLVWNRTHRRDVEVPVLRWRLAYERVEVPAGRRVAEWPVSSPGWGPDRLVLVDTVVGGR